MKERSVLIVEDDDQIRNNLEEYISRKGYKVITATNGKEALEKFRASENIVVVTDLKMPELGGLELLEAIKGKYPSTQIIILSGNYEIQDSITAVRFHAFDFIHKTKANRSKILDSIDRAFEESIIVQREIEAALKNQKEVLSFLSHTIGNTIATSPLTIRDLSEEMKELIPNPSLEQERKIQSILNELAELNSTFVSIDKMLKIVQLFAKEQDLAMDQWKDDENITEGVGLEFLIALAIKQSLGRILFEYQHVKKRKLYFLKNEIPNVKKRFTHDLIADGFSELKYGHVLNWVRESIPFIEIDIVESKTQFNLNGIRFNILLACIYEILYNALKYSDNRTVISVKVKITDSGFGFSCTNSFDLDSVKEKGTSKGLSFIDQILSVFPELEFTYKQGDSLFTANLNYG